MIKLVLCIVFRVVQVSERDLTIASAKQMNFELILTNRNVHELIHLLRLLQELLDKSMYKEKYIRRPWSW